MTWVTALSCFPVELVEYCGTMLALSGDPFPQLGDLVIRIQTEQSKRSTQVTQADPSRPTAATVRAVMKAMNLGEVKL